MIEQYNAKVEDVATDDKQVNLESLGMTSEEFATRLLKEERVAAVPGSAFGESGEGHLRISYAYSLENLKKAMERFKNFVEKLRKETTIEDV